MSVFRIRMLLAGHGDCLLVEYGPDEDDLHRFLIDGGTKGTFARLEPAVTGHDLELVVVTHIDADHIAGALRLFEEETAATDDVWFNGYCHLPDTDLEDFGPVQGETLTTMLRDGWTWNGAFGGKAVAVPDDGPLPAHTLPGGMKLTVLSPSTERLRQLKPVWQAECQKHGLDPVVAPPPPPEPPDDIEVFGPPNVAQLAATPFAEDTSKANGSSIALLAEYGGKSALLAGDAYPTELIAGIDRLLGAGEVLEVDAFKLPHHGSKANVSQDLLARLSCPRFLVSTNGAYFKHPDKVAIARVIAHCEQPELIFNAKTKHNKMWAPAALQQQHDYTATFPDADGDAEITIEL